MAEVEAQAGFRPDQKPFDVLRPLDHAAESWEHRQPESMSRANMLDGTDQVKEMRPPRAVEDDAVRRPRAAWRDRRQDQRFRAHGREPAGVAVDMGELRTTYVVVMKDCVRFAGHDAQPVAAQERLGPVAAIRPEAGRARINGGDTQGPDLRQHAVRVELLAPPRPVAYPPQRRRECDAQPLPIVSRPPARNPLQRAPKHGAEINRMLNARLVVR